MPRVELTRHLHTFFPQLADRELVFDVATVADVVRELEALAPGIAFYLCDERGRLRTHVNVFIGNDRISDRQSLKDAVGPNDKVFIAQALSGG